MGDESGIPSLCLEIRDLTCSLILMESSGRGMDSVILRSTGLNRGNPRKSQCSSPRLPPIRRNHHDRSPFSGLV